MYLSNYYLPTLKESPASAEVISHQLMLRSGMIKQTTAGIYTWLPLGLLVYRRVESIVREEMNRIGALEVDMPNVQPAEIWQDSGRWSDYGSELLRFKDRHDRDFCLGPTHEEVIVNLLQGEVKSYKQLPLTFYQIQKKFRDERRPRFGVMRGREFLMKDAYSFHIDMNSLKETYSAMYDAYCRIFDRLGLNYRAVVADNGSIGGDGSHEFHVLAKTGEDFIAFSNESNYAANIEMAPCLMPEKPFNDEVEPLEKVHTPNCKTIDTVCQFLSKPIEKTIKTLLVLDENDEIVALCLRGDHRLNEIKAEKIKGLKVPLEMAPEAQVVAKLGCSFGSIGPVNFSGRIIVDLGCAKEASLICGANEDDYHLVGMNWQRDVANDIELIDIREIEQGDISPDGKGFVEIQKGIEVGHIFQLGDKYSASMGLNVLDQNGSSITPVMGCYGIGITRIVAAAIEQNHDEFGIKWPLSMAPFDVVVAPIGYKKSDEVRRASLELYNALKSNQINVAIDDRDVRPGLMFKELDLIGVPYRLVVSEKTLVDKEVEYKCRQTGQIGRVLINDLSALLKIIENK